MTVRELSTHISNHFLGLIVNKCLQIVNGESCFGWIDNNKVDYGRNVHRWPIQIWHWRSLNLQGLNCCGNGFQLPSEDQWAEVKPRFSFDVPNLSEYLKYDSLFWLDCVKTLEDSSKEGNNVAQNIDDYSAEDLGATQTMWWKLVD